MKENEKYKNYLLDLGYLIREEALAARVITESTKYDYSVGYLMAFYKVISLMKQQADVFLIPTNEINLDGIDPERNILKP